MTSSSHERQWKEAREECNIPFKCRKKKAVHSVHDTPLGASIPCQKPGSEQDFLLTQTFQSYGTLDLATSIYTTTSIPTESSWSPCISPKLQQQLLDDSLCPRLACKYFIPGSKNTDHVTILQKSLNDSLWHLT